MAAVHGRFCAIPPITVISNSSGIASEEDIVEEFIFLERFSSFAVVLLY
jgi:hypothetical protein